MQTPLPEVLQFMQVMWRVVHGLEQRSKRMAARTGITGPQRLVLRLVALNPGISPRELADLLHLHPSTVTGVLQRLDRQRLLVREAHAADGRRAVLTLSAKGRRANRVTAGTVEAEIGAVLRSLSAHDRACARRVLEAIAARVETHSV